MKVVYDGIFDEVEILDSGQTAKRGEPIEVEDGLAAQLLGQSIWRKAERGLDYSVNSDGTTTPPIRRGGKQ